MKRFTSRSPWPRAMVAVLLLTAGCHFKNAAEKAAAAIVEKNIAARGGLSAWRAVKSMTLSGSLEAGKRRDPAKLAAAYLRSQTEAKAQAKVQAQAAEPAADAVRLPFVLELERPGKSRLEIRFQGQTAVQVFDGKHGWKVRPFLGRREVEPYNDEELRQSALQTDIDGPLIDSSSQNSKVELVGTEMVEGREAHKLKVTLASGQVRNVWVDAQTSLDLCVDGSRKMDGKPKTVWTCFKDYRTVGGLLLPHLMETTVEGVRDSEKIIVERVMLNPKFDNARFTKPQ